MTAPCIRPFSIPYNTQDILGSYSSAKNAAKKRDRQLYIIGRETEVGNPLDKLIAYRKERQIAPGFQEAQIERLAGDNYSEKQFRQQSLALMEQQVTGVRDMSRKLEQRTAQRLQDNPAIISAERAGRATGGLADPMLDVMQQAREARRIREQRGGAVAGGWRSELGIPAEIGAGEAPQYLMGMGSFIGSDGQNPASFATPLSLEPNDPYLSGLFTSLASPLAQLQPNAEIGDLRGRVTMGGSPASALPQSTGSLQLVPEAPVVRSRGRARRAVAPMSEVEAEMEQRRGIEGAEGGQEQPKPKGRPKGSRSAVSGGQAGQTDIRTFVLDEEQLAELFARGGLSASGGQSASGDPGHSDISAIRDSNLSDEEKVKRAIQARPLTMEELSNPDMDLNMMEEYGRYLLRYPDSGTFKRFLQMRKQDISQASRAPGGGRVGGGFGGLH